VVSAFEVAASVVVVVAAACWSSWGPRTHGGSSFADFRSDGTSPLMETVQS